MQIIIISYCFTIMHVYIQVQQLYNYHTVSMSHDLHRQCSHQGGLGVQADLPGGEKERGDEREGGTSKSAVWGLLGIIRGFVIKC